MQLTLKNQTGSPLSYVQGQVTCPASSNAAVPRDYNTLLLGDATFLSDANSGTVILNNGSTDLTGPSIQILATVFAQFSLSPLATLPLYYCAPVNIRQTAATAANSTVWSMRNDASSLKLVTIESIKLMMHFDTGTPLQRSSLRYELRRFSTATPSGGTSITPVLRDSLAPSTSVTDARFLDTGLTVTSVVFDNPFAIIGCPASDGSTNSFSQDIVPFKLAAGEGLCIRLSQTAAIGQGLFGEIIWAER